MAKGEYLDSVVLVLRAVATGLTVPRQRIETHALIADESRATAEAVPVA